MKRVPIIQICGPIGYGKLPSDEQLQLANEYFLVAEKKLRAMGYIVINPMRTDFLPGTNYNAMLDYSIDLIHLHADMLLVLPNADQSTGCVKEMLHASQKEIPIIPATKAHYQELEDAATIKHLCHPSLCLCPICKGKGVRGIVDGFLGDPIIYDCECMTKKAV